MLGTKQEMHGLLAMLFPGMGFIPLIGIFIGLLLFSAFGTVSYLLLRRTHIKGRVAVIALSSVLGLAPVAGLIIWLTCWDPPLKLPAGAKDVRIHRLLPFDLAIDDNMRFHVSPAEFRTW